MKNEVNTIKEEIIGEILNLNNACLNKNFHEAEKVLSKNFVFNFYEGNTMERTLQKIIGAKSLPDIFGEIDIKRFDQIDYSIKVINSTICIANKFYIEYIKEHQLHVRTGTETFVLHKEPTGWKFDSRTMRFENEE
ncbi:MAG: hypothetical protein V1720_12235 [bacterium]